MSLCNHCFIVYLLFIILFIPLLRCLIRFLLSFSSSFFLFFHSLSSICDSHFSHMHNINSCANLYYDL